MSFFGRSELGDTDDPTELVPGSATTLDETAGGLRKLATASQEAYAGLSTLDVGHWTGEAADKFSGYFAKETPKWRDAAEAFGPVVEVLTTYKGAVEQAQRQAAEAIRIYKEAEQATKNAEREYDAAASQYEKVFAAAQAAGDAVPGPFAPFSDPGKAQRDNAERILADARKAVREAAAQAVVVVNRAKNKAPEEPGFLSKFAASFEDTFDMAVDQIGSFHSGLAQSGINLLKMVRAGNPLDPYNVTHPGEYAAHMMQQAAGMVHMVTHPVDAVKGILNVEQWKKDPFAAMGQLVGDVGIAIATDGAGLAGTAEKAVLREATEMSVREAAEQVGTQVGRHVDDGLPPWHRADYEPPSHTPDYHNPHPDEPFGPQKTEPDDHLPHDREPDTPDSPAEEPKREPDEQPKIREPEHLPEPDKSHYFRLQDLVREIDTRMPDLPFAERQGQQELMNSYRQSMRDIMAKHG